VITAGAARSLEAVLDAVSLTPAELARLAAGGRVDEAARLAASAPATSRATALAAVARAAADREGPGGRALDLAERAEASLPASAPAEPWSSVAVARALSMSGDEARGCALLEQALAGCGPWRRHRGWPVYALVSFASSTGKPHPHLHRAEVLAAAIRPDGWRDDAYAAVAATAASLGDRVGAHRVLDAIAAPWPRTEAWLGVAGPDELEALDRAEGCARQVDYGAWRDEALAAVVRARAHHGQLVGAAVLAGEIDDPMWAAEAGIGIAAAEVAADPEAARARSEAAFAVADGAGDRWWHHRAGAVAALAEAWTATGAVALGVDLVDRVGPSPLRAGVLAGAAAGLGRRAGGLDGEAADRLCRAVVALAPEPRRAAAAVELLGLLDRAI
jgi:hypothetical protein